jgi:Fe2+ transport system protein FeoA
LIVVIETYSQTISIMRLNEIKRGGKFRVTKVNCDNESIARLMAMGLLPGQEIRLTHEAPLGDPIAVHFEGCHMSLRLEDAAEVEVEKL